MVMNGVILVDKPKGWTSFDVVAKVRGELRRISGNRKIKVGHSGTLDPMATGLLIVLVGLMTKQQDSFMKKDKVYEAEVTLGQQSTTDDAEGELESSGYEVGSTNKGDIISALEGFVGEIDQLPPNFSAIKVNGKRAYELARAGQKTELKSRRVTIYSIDEVQITGVKVSFRCHVSSGTYIRSLARDVGEILGCGAHLSALRRTSIGEWDVSKAYAISDLTDEILQKALA